MAQSSYKANLSRSRVARSERTTNARSGVNCEFEDICKFRPSLKCILQYDNQDEQCYYLEKQSCGHPRLYAGDSAEGTHWCSMCEKEAHEAWDEQYIDSQPGYIPAEVLTRRVR